MTSASMTEPPRTSSLQPSIPFIKAHTNGNSFLIVLSSSLLPPLSNLARQICSPHTGIGADGLILSSLCSKILTLTLFNSDGSPAEISGNGTCCAAAVAVWKGHLGKLVACTGAGRKELRFLRREGNLFHFEVDMGVPIVEERSVDFQLDHPIRKVDGMILNVGNPQCAIMHDGDLPCDWKTIAHEIAASPRFPNGINISFSRVLNVHTLLSVFFERGAGETSSSGTGSIGAAAAAMLRGFVNSPVEVRTETGALIVRWDGEGGEIVLEGHAEIVAEGMFFLR